MTRPPHLSMSRGSTFRRYRQKHAVEEYKQYPYQATHLDTPEHSPPTSTHVVIPGKCGPRIAASPELGDEHYDQGTERDQYCSKKYPER